MPKYGKRVVVTSESDTGRNNKFQDIKDGTEMTRSQFVSEIKKGIYTSYYVKYMNGLATPVSKPDKSEANNLG